MKDVMCNIFIGFFQLGHLLFVLLLGSISACCGLEAIFMGKIILHNPNSVGAGMIASGFFGLVGTIAGIIAIQQAINFVKNCYDLLSDFFQSNSHSS